MDRYFQTFSYNNYEIKTIDRDGDIWFVAKDIADALEFKDVCNVTAHLDDDEKGVCILFTGRTMQELKIINDSGLFTLILRSNKPNAKDFHKWVADTVLPSFRMSKIQHEKYIKQVFSIKITRRRNHEAN